MARIWGKETGRDWTWGIPHDVGWLSIDPFGPEDESFFWLWAQPATSVYWQGQDARLPTLMVIPIRWDTLSFTQSYPGLMPYYYLPTPHPDWLDGWSLEAGVGYWW
ncbi:hypothetical protein D2Q93_01140 [Alicyclobacillaceae bacterium I2511]|nr:hypothetical protein D2Q93_01140 [Alicyclobacillaceae bacterium I2511]